MTVLTSPTGANYNTRLNAEITNIYAGKYGTTGAREQAIKILQSEFPNVDVAKDIYNRAPDGWEKMKVKIEAGTGGLSTEVGGWNLSD